MYAITEFGYRKIDFGYELNHGEKVVSVIPEPLFIKMDENIFRSKRNLLLKDSDWTQLPNSPLSEDDCSKWEYYRQSLRDIPDKEGFPYCSFPNPPA